MAVALGRGMRREQKARGLGSGHLHTTQQFLILKPGKQCGAVETARALEQAGEVSR